MKLIRVIFSFTLLLGILSCKKKDSLKQDRSIEAYEFSLGFSDELDQGDELKVTINSIQEFDRSELNIIITDYIRSYDLNEISRNVYSIKVENICGLVKLQAIYSGKPFYEEHFTISCNQELKSIELYGGPKTIRSNEEALATALNFNEYGKEIDQNILFSSYEREREIEKGEQIELVRYKRTIGGKKTSEEFISSYDTIAKSNLINISTIAGHPTDFEIQIARSNYLSDGYNESVIETNVIKDKNNNIIADGTITFLDVYEHDTMTGSYQSYSINGRATFYIKNPNNQKKWTLQARTYHSISNSISLAFKKNVKSYELLYDSKKEIVRVSRIQGAYDQLVQDGTEVEFILTGTTRTESVIRQSRSGKAVLSLTQNELDSLISVQIISGGFKKTLNHK